MKPVRSLTAPLNAFPPPGGNLSASASHSWQESRWSRCGTPKPQIVEMSNYILLIGMLTPWNSYCNRALDIPISTKENSLAMIRWKDLCYCGFSAGTFYINENIISCEDDKRRLSSKISTYYTINAITADYFHETMSEINKMGNKLMLEMGKQINIIDMSYANSNKKKQNRSIWTRAHLAFVICILNGRQIT